MTADLAGQRAELYALLDREIASRRSGWERVAPLGGRDDIVLVFSLSQDKSSVYMKAGTPDAAAWIVANGDALSRHLRTTLGQGTGQADKGYYFRKDNPRACFTIRRHWPEILRWFKAQHATFDKAIRTVENAT